MPADVDIIVTSPDTADVRLVAETRLSLPDMSSAETILKTAMVRMSSPVGILITPDRMWVYLDRYLSQTPDSVDRVGEFDVSKLLHFRPVSASRDEERHFEAVVQQWLEDLPRLVERAPRKDDHLWSVVNTYIIPAVETGEIRAAAPRYPH